MASKNDTTKNDPDTTAPTAPPTGFDIKAEKVMGDGWVLKKPGTIVYGELCGEHVGSQTNDRGEFTNFYQIKLLAPCMATTKEENSQDKKEILLNPGQILNVGDNAGFSELSSYANNGGVYNVWVKFVKLEKQRNDPKKTVWVMQGPRLQQVKPPTRHGVKPTRRKAIVDGNGQPVFDGDVPFGR